MSTPKISPQISTAVILAAGAGTRLHPITFNAPKCLTEINGTPILGRMLDSLLIQNFKRVIIVTGHLGHQIRHFAQQLKWFGLNIEFVHNSDFLTTNNIYSLYLAINRINEGILLLEADLVYEPAMLQDLVVPDSIAIASYSPHMNGTAVTIDLFGRVSQFLLGKNPTLAFPELNLFKTVNIYSFSLGSWKKVARELGKWIKAGKLNDYYEVVFSDLVVQNEIFLNGVNFDAGNWFEVDTLTDLRHTEQMFSNMHTLPALPNRIS